MRVACAQNTLVTRCKLFLRANYIYVRILIARRRWSRTRGLRYAHVTVLVFLVRFQRVTIRSPLKRNTGSSASSLSSCSGHNTLCFTGVVRISADGRAAARANLINIQVGNNMPAIITYHCHYYYIGGQERNKIKI